jgi:hypothetical protein
MSCTNPKSEFSAENCETLGPKIQNSRNCNLRVVGGVLREVVHPYVIFSPNVLVLSVGTPKKERVVRIFGNPGRSYGSAEERGWLLEACAMVLQDLCSDTMLNFHYAWLKHECYPRYLGITRRSCLEAHMVLDMEYRERD